jgi:hypothetical protein
VAPQRSVFVVPGDIVKRLILDQMTEKGEISVYKSRARILDARAVTQFIEEG